MSNRQNYINSAQNNRDFGVLQYGYRKCAPGFYEQKKARETYIIYYVYSGKGVFTLADVSYSVSGGQAIFIAPNVEMTHETNENEPLEYRWVEFYGDKAEALISECGLSPEAPVYNDKSGSLAAAFESLVSMGKVNEYQLSGAFRNIAAAMSGALSKPANPYGEHFNKAVAYIQAHISDGVNVSDIARHLNISRGYLTLVFNSISGKSTKQYIIDYKIDVAKRLLRNTGMSIEEVGESVGVVSPGHFSRLFKTETGCSPLEYRRGIGP